MNYKKIFEEWRKESFTADWEGCEPSEVMHVDDIKAMLKEMRLL